MNPATTAAPAAAAAGDAAPVSVGAWRNRKKLIVVALAGVVGTSVLGAATWALWPKPPVAVAKKKGEKPAKGATRVAGAASGAVTPAASGVEAHAEARPMADAAPGSASAVAAASAPALETAVRAHASAPPKPADVAVAGHAAPQAAIQPAAQAAAHPALHAPAHATAPVRATAPPIEDPMDKLRRRLAETLGNGGKLESRPSGELRVVSTRGQPPASADSTIHAVHAVSSHAGATTLTAHPSAAPRSRRSEIEPHGVTGAGHSPHWDYSGNAGPEAWGGLRAEFATCSKGTRQSPIDIRDGIKVQLDPVQFAYQPSGFSVIDNGHTVQVDVAAGNAIEVQGRRFGLVQFHFHRPSEERIDGKQFDMVVHLVHKDDAGRLAVIAVLLERGSAQAIVQSVWNNLPLEKGEAQPARGLLDLNRLLPEDRSYYTYMGSLTTPPCSEGVLWMVMRNPVPISPEQIAVFSRLYPMNARPLQAASGRLIKESQ